MYETYVHVCRSVHTFASVQLHYYRNIFVKAATESTYEISNVECQESVHTDPRRSPTVVNLWIGSDVFHLRELYAH
jgi:hypothetical protein